MNKVLLLKKIQTGYEQFQSLLTTLDEITLTQPGVVGGWSVKDILAHMVAHEQRMLNWMTERLGGKNPITCQPFDMPEKELNELNEQIFQENRERDWKDVFQDLEKTHLQTLAFVVAVDEDALMSTQRFQLLGGEALWEAVAANTYEHCEEHGKDIREWMNLKGI